MPTLLSMEEFASCPDKWTKDEIDYMCMYSAKGKFTPEFIDKYHKYFDWTYLVRGQAQGITEKIFDKYKRNFDQDFWNVYFYSRRDLSEQFIRKHCKHHYFNWSVAIKFQNNLSEEFYDEFTDKFRWTDLFEFQCLDSDFLRRHIDKIVTPRDWSNISEFSNLDEQFILDYAYRLNWEHIIRNQLITSTIIVECADYINFRTLLNTSEAYVNYKHTEYNLRLIFEFAPEKISITNYKLWKDKISANFAREFTNRFPTDIWFCIKKRDKSNKLREEFVKRLKRQNWAHYGI